MDDLDHIIREIQVTSELSAETRNALHGATSGHPWCKGKTLATRLLDVQFAIAGRMSVSHALALQVEQMAQREARNGAGA